MQIVLVPLRGNEPLIGIIFYIIYKTLCYHAIELLTKKQYFYMEIIFHLRFFFHSLFLSMTRASPGRVAVIHLIVHTRDPTVLLN